VEYRNHSLKIQAPISDELIEAIRAVSPIEEVVGEHVQLRRSGVELKGRCPFHEEHTPSFAVNPSKGVFVCHGCGVGGDVYVFVQLLLKVGFKEAISHLAKRAGVDMEGFAPTPELTAKVAALKAHYEDELAFECFCNHRIGAINQQCRSLGRAATHAEDYLRAGESDPYLHDLAWSALERYRLFELRVEREGLCDPSVLRTEWELIRDAA
jgi:hypothetical protein